MKIGFNNLRGLLVLFLLTINVSAAFAAKPDAKFQLRNHGNVLNISSGNQQCQAKMFVQAVSSKPTAAAKKNVVNIPSSYKLKISLKGLSRIRGFRSQNAYIRTNFICANGKKYSDLDRIQIPASRSGKKGYSSLRRWIQNVRIKLAEQVALISVVATPTPTPAPTFAPQNIKVVEAFPNLTFSSPADLQDADDGSNNLYVVELSGKIQRFDNNSSVTDKSEFLNITSKLKSGGEQGLLGLAFHPDFEQNGYFFVNYVRESDGATVIARYTYTGTLPVDTDTEFILLTVPQPYDNHNGGSLQFGPDGYLYIAMGDGGSGGDPHGYGQNLQSLLGKILRIDVDNPESGGANYSIPASNPFSSATDGTRREIFAYGLRNPWRMSFDFQTGRLWVADVGQAQREEVNIVESGKNYGWNIMEGFLCHPAGSTCNSSGLTLPILDYPRSEGQSVTGGYVYRGTQIPELEGVYIYGDFLSGKIWGIRGIDPLEHALLVQTSNLISSFGRDRNGEVYVVDIGGKILKLSR